jgi:hypothetical protein
VKGASGYFSHLYLTSVPGYDTYAIVVAKFLAKTSYEYRFNLDCHYIQIMPEKGFC